LAPRKKTDAAAKPDHSGHRDRLRARFMAGGPDALPDYELLELLLFNVIQRQDTKQQAKLMIERFGGLAGVFAAPVDQLTRISGITENGAAFLKTVHAVAARMGRQTILELPTLSSSTALHDYLRTAMAHEAREQFRILFLNRKNALIADEVQTKGTIDHAPVYVREVVKRALELGATALILVHNHPSGDPTPSRADIEMTREIVRAAAPLGVTVHDHIIVGRGEPASLRALGLMG
jgi:DNA repair protein RadC